MWKKTNEDEKEFARQDLAKLTAKAEQGLIDLACGDQAGFNLYAKVAYAWQKRGERIVLPVSKGKSQNVLGFMWHRCQRFAAFVFEGATAANVVLWRLDFIAESLEKETWIVLDNSPSHQSEEFEEKIKEWAKLGLKIYYLPTYRNFAVLLDWRTIGGPCAATAAANNGSQINHLQNFIRKPPSFIWSGAADHFSDATPNKFCSNIRLRLFY